MTDKLFQKQGVDWHQKYVDMGDGTFAERVIADVRSSQANVTNKSGTITSGGVAQTLSAANTSRRGFLIQNQSTGDLWLSSTELRRRGSRATHSTAGAAALYAGGGAAVNDKIAIVNDRIKIVIASGGATKTGTFHFVLV